MKSSSLLKGISIVCFILLAMATAAFGQSDSGRVAGTITDNNGGVVAGAKVLVTNESTGQSRSTTTTADGAFLISPLQPAMYTIAVSANNFDTHMDITLHPNGLTAQVDLVSGEDYVINPSSASMSANVNPR